MASQNLRKQEIVVVWFKRDLRFTDHEALFYAQKQGLPVLLMYFFEPSIMNYDDSDVRHWRFVYQSLLDMQDKLENLKARLYIFHDEAHLVFQALTEEFSIKTVFSHEEIGNKLTFDRDLELKKFFKTQNIAWNEYQHNGIIRKLKSRNDWEKRWKQKMLEEPKLVAEQGWKILQLENDFYDKLKGPILKKEITLKDPNFQPGGETTAWKYLNSFLKERYVNYSKHISKPALSRKGCSRISPYLAYGNLSMRMVYQYTMQHYESSINKRALSNFVSRLHWHCHFIQKFEDECRMEFENVNRAYNQLVKPKNETYIAAWQKGETGIEPIDLTIKKVLETGYCHHIERLMVLGNFMLLCEFDPDKVYRWFMEMFIDFYDWVMVPNVYGMSQFADGGLMSTKPYISGSNYLMKMSDYKKGEWQVTWDGLFWRFMHVHRDFFLQNPRIGMLVHSFDKMSTEKKEQHLNAAEKYLKSLDDVKFKE
jgi:deoxyribodipyrimidine photo-lyase